MTGLLSNRTSLDLALNAIDPGRPSRHPAGLRARKGTDRTDRANSVGVPGLAALMALSDGRREMMIALVDGPVDIDHPELMSEHIVECEVGCAAHVPGSATSRVRMALRSRGS